MWSSDIEALLEIGEFMAECYLQHTWAVLQLEAQARTTLISEAAVPSRTGFVFTCTAALHRAHP